MKGKMDKTKHMNVLDVEAETVEVTITSDEVSEVKSHASYSHHMHYGEGVEAPELPQAPKPYQSTKAKLWLVMSSMALAAITLSVVKNVQSKVQTQKFNIPAPHHVSYGQQKMNQTMDMMAMNTVAFEKSLTNFGKIVENKKALAEVETVLHKQRYDKKQVISDDKARDLLLRAGYSPSQITDAQMASFKKRYSKSVGGDVDFARDMAGDIVKEEVESFVHKAKIVSNIGQYIYNRLQE